MFPITSLITLSLAAAALAHPGKRQLAQVITTCNTPNTVAMTFVSIPLITLRVSNQLYIASRMMVLTSMGTRFLCAPDDPRVNQMLSILVQTL